MRALGLKGLLFIFLADFCLTSTAQTIYSVDASAVSTTIKTGQLRMGNPGPAGKELIVNNRYLTLAGKPILPVMGEMQFSREPRSQWETLLLKMKACGISIVSFYVFWNHHEEIEGQFNWSDNKNLHAFVQLCAKHGLWVFPRIGPWVHGEARYGGTPDWLLAKSNLHDRSNDPLYQHYAAEWYKEVAAQLKGLLYKDGGPVIGIQLENEYAHGKAGEPHIAWLKQTAMKYGLDVPMYTVTGWGDGSVPDHEVIPMWGAYPDAPWNGSLDKNTDCTEFRFMAYRNSDKIGNDLAKAKTAYLDYGDFPYFTCEMGVGIENTNQRRLQIGPIDGLGLIMARVGSGVNLPGYYIFTGGSNPHGLLTTLEENQAETGYPNTNPIISYDFQAAIRESGELNKPYYEIKKLHYFLNEFGSRLAPMAPVFPARQSDFQYTVRAKDNNAFLFGMNYCRHSPSAEVNNVHFSIKLKQEVLDFPSKPITIPDSSLFIWPVNFPLHDVLLKYATAQPLCTIADKWVFIQDMDNAPEFCFDAANIDKLESANGSVNRENGRYIVSGLRPGRDCVITLREKNGTVQKLILLSKEEAKQAWLFSAGEQKNFFLSDADLYLNGETLHASTTLDNIHLAALSGEKSGSVFKDFTYSVRRPKINLAVVPLKPLTDAKWLKSNAPDSLNGNNAPLHHFFLKQFNLDNPSKIRMATLTIALQSTCKIRVNNSWIDQVITLDSMNTVNLTTYLQKGENELLLDFPFKAGQKAFAANLTVEYQNRDRVTFLTDETWYNMDALSCPDYRSRDGGYAPPMIITPVEALNMPLRDRLVFRLAFPSSCLDSLDNLYLRMIYTGDKAKIWLDQQLAADDFFNGCPWTVGLNRLGIHRSEAHLQLEITPLAADARVYFDDQPAKEAATRASLKDIRLQSQYGVDIKIKTLGPQSSP